MSVWLREECVSHILHKMKAIPWRWGGKNVPGDDNGMVTAMDKCTDEGKQFPVVLQAIFILNCLICRTAFLEK